MPLQGFFRVGAWLFVDRIGRRWVARRENLCPLRVNGIWPRCPLVRGDSARVFYSLGGTGGPRLSTGTRASRICIRFRSNLAIASWTTLHGIDLIGMIRYRRFAASPQDRVAVMHRQPEGLVTETFMNHGTQSEGCSTREGIDGYAGSIVQAWMDRPSPPKNLLNPALTRLELRRPPYVLCPSRSISSSPLTFRENGFSGNPPVCGSVHVDGFSLRAFSTNSTL